MRNDVIKNQIVALTREHHYEASLRVGKITLFCKKCRGVGLWVFANVCNAGGGWSSSSLLLAYNVGGMASKGLRAIHLSSYNKL